MEWVDYSIVAVLGIVVGLGELVSRYKERPVLAVANPPGIAYIAINLAAACGSLLLIREFGWNFGMEPGDDALRATQLLTAGFGAMALLRSSLFVVRVGDRDVGIGPGVVLAGMTEAADLAVQRHLRNAVVRIRGRLARIAAKGVDFDYAVVALPLYCLALSGDVSPERQQELGDQVQSLRSTELPDAQKLVVLALTCMQFFGEATVVAAIEEFGDTLARPKQP